MRFQSACISETLFKHRNIEILLQILFKKILFDIKMNKEFVENFLEYLNVKQV